MALLYLCPDNPNPCGGTRTMYRHVEILNRHGLPSAVVHDRPGFRCEWFKSDAPVRGLRELRLRPEDDILIIPEVHGPRADRIAPGVRKVIFNQGVYNTFNGYALDPTALETPYRHPDFVAAMVVSEDSRRYLGFVFPDLPVFRVYHSIVVSGVPPFSKKRRIAYIPNKNVRDVIQVVNMLKFRGRLSSWEMVPLANMSETAFAQNLRDAAVFLSFSIQEGFGLPPAEAMANGCIVVGYDGFGGREYLHPDLAFPVTTGDVQAFAETVERVALAWDETPSALQVMAGKASRLILETYTPARAEQSVLNAWKTIISGASLKRTSELTTV